MAEVKTRPTDASVSGFIDTVAHAGRREDSRALAALLERVTGQPPVMWGGAIIGFGRRPYRLANGKTSEMIAIGFSPRKTSLTLYFDKRFDGADALIARMARMKRQGSCLHLNRLGDVDADLLEDLALKAWARAQNPLDL